MRRTPLAALALLLASGAASANDYPTAAIADYVFACMAVNGQTRDALERCSCSIDVVASLLPYEEYVQAETVLQMRAGGGGERLGMFRGAPWAEEIVSDLRYAQAEAEVRCF